MADNKYYLLVPEKNKMSDQKYKNLVPDSDEEEDSSTISRTGYLPSDDTDSSAQSREPLPKKDYKKSSLQAILLASSKVDIPSVNRQDANTSPFKQEKGTSPFKEKGTSPFKEKGTSQIKHETAMSAPLVPMATEFQPTARQSLTTEERNKVLDIFKNVVGYSLRYPDFDNMYDNNYELQQVVVNVMERFGCNYKKARDSVIQSFRGFKRSKEAKKDIN